MRRVFRTLAVIVIACVAVVLLSYTVLSDTPLGEQVRGLSEGATNAAANAALDASGVKERVDEALRSNAGAISSATGLSESQVTEAIDSLDVTSWSAVSLPSDVTVRDTASGTHGGVTATVTTYDDPSYVTVETSGQTLTFAVPESAQGYAQLLSYL